MEAAMQRLIATAEAAGGTCWIHYSSQAEHRVCLTIPGQIAHEAMGVSMAEICDRVIAAAAATAEKHAQHDAIRAAETAHILAAIRQHAR